MRFRDLGFKTAGYEHKVQYLALDRTDNDFWVFAKSRVM